jgi:hypothetical protein
MRALGAVFVLLAVLGGGCGGPGSGGSGAAGTSAGTAAPTGSGGSSSTKGTSGGSTAAGASTSSGSSLASASSGGSTGSLPSCGQNSVWEGDVCTRVTCLQAPLNSPCLLQDGGSGFCAAGLCQNPGLSSPSNCTWFGAQCPEGDRCVFGDGCVADGGLVGCGSNAPQCPADTECSAGSPSVCLWSSCTSSRDDQACGLGGYLGFCCGTGCVIGDDPTNCGACGLSCGGSAICLDEICGEALLCVTRRDGWGIGGPDGWWPCYRERGGSAASRGNRVGGRSRTAATATPMTCREEQRRGHPMQRFSEGGITPAQGGVTVPAAAVVSAGGRIVGAGLIVRFTTAGADKSTAVQAGAAFARRARAAKPQTAAVAGEGRAVQPAVFQAVAGTWIRPAVAEAPVVARLRDRTVAGSASIQRAQAQALLCRRAVTDRPSRRPAGASADPSGRAAPSVAACASGVGTLAASGSARPPRAATSARGA